MGFMGLGIQKWIYTMRLRQPFSMQQKSSFTVVKSYSRTFKLRPSKNKGSYDFGIPFFFILVIVLGFSAPRWLRSTKIHQNKLTVLRNEKDNKAFQLLLQSGKKRLNNQNLESAYREFKLAQAIKPNDIELNTLMLEVATLLCNTNETFCNEFDTLNF